MQREHDAAQAETRNLVVNLQETTDPHEHGLLSAELSLLVAKLREQRKWIGLCEAEVQHAQDRMLSERQPPSQAVYVRSSVCDAHLGYRYFGKPHEQAAYNLGQPPHERMHRCCEPFVLDTRFGTRTLTERPHYGPHGLPHHQEAYSDYGLPQPPHQQEWLNATKRRGRAVLQRIDEDLRNLEHPYFQAEPVETAAPIGRLFEPRHSQDGIAQQQPFIGRQPTVVTAEVVGSFPEQHCFWQQPTYSDYGLPGVAYCDYDGLHEPPHEHTVFVEQHSAHSAAAQCLGQPQEQAACFEQAMTADTSERLEPTHPQPTEVSEGLCPASHRRQYYSDDFAGGGGYCREGAVGEEARRA